MYLAVTTRPDVTFAVNPFSQACKSPTVKNFIAAKQTHLKGTKYYLSVHDMIMV